jgi:hypothetical protein
MDGDRIEQVLVKHAAAGSVGITAQSDHWLKRFERLYPSLEADGSWLDAVSGRRLRRDCANEIVSQDMYSELLLGELRNPIAQDVHLQRYFSDFTSSSKNQRKKTAGGSKRVFLGRSHFKGNLHAAYKPART